jgi:hypothetical protein
VRLLDYQRFVIGYHGCDKEIADRVLTGEGDLEYSSNQHDWLGKGIYFWEYGPHRAYEWAQWRSKGIGGPGVKIKSPAVVGALIQLGHCFDLLDTLNTKFLAEAFEEFKRLNEGEGLVLPQNEQSHKNDLDFTKRLLDCAVVNFAVELIEQRRKAPVHSVRCIFSEGSPAFDGSLIFAKSHIQIAVRDRAAILGYFKPNIDFARFS